MTPGESIDRASRLKEQRATQSDPTESQPGPAGLQTNLKKNKKLIVGLKNDARNVEKKNRGGGKCRILGTSHQTKQHFKQSEPDASPVRRSEPPDGRAEEIQVLLEEFIVDPQ